MKQLISTLWFVLIFSTAALAQTQLVNGVFYSKDPLLAGCKVFIEDGLLYTAKDFMAKGFFNPDLNFKND